MPHASGLFAFELCPPKARAQRRSGESAGSPAAACAVSRGASCAECADADAARELRATDSFVLLAESAEQRREWVRQIGALLTAP